MEIPRLVAASILAAVLSLPLATPALASHVASWKALTGANGSGQAQPGALHTPDGVLHVVYRVPHPGGSGEDAVARTIQPSGTIGAPATISTFNGLNNPNLTLVPSGLLAFLPGQKSGTYEHVAAATAPAAGSPWSLSADDVADPSGNYYVQPAGATTDHAGVVYLSGGRSVHRGLDPKSPSFDYQAKIGGGCCAYESDLATDGATGQVWLAWYSNASPNEGVYVHEVDTASGAPKGSPQRMPGSVTSFGGTLKSSSQFYRVPITARAGKAGIWLAWPGGYPSEDSVVAWRRGDAKARVLHADSKTTVKATAVAADFQGRLWVAWSETRDDRLRIVARRSNPDGTSWGSRTTVVPPRAAENAYNLTAAAGGDGELAVFGQFDMADGDAQLWYRQLVPALTLNARSTIPPGQKVKIVARVTDAGERVAGATIRLGAATATTDSSGRAALTVGPFSRGDRLRLRASAKGYRSASRLIRVR